MADIKWIKITTDIFNNRKIRQIECLPDGDSIIVIWVKLLTLAGNINDEGKIYFTEEIPYTDQMLSAQFNRPLVTVQLALKTFEEFGMIEVIDNVLCISNWKKYQNVEGMEKVREQTRLRVARYKENKKIEGGNVSGNVNVTQGNATDIDIDKELDIDKDIDTKEKENNITVSKDTVRQTETVRQVVEKWNALSDVGIKSISKINNDSKRYKSLIARIKQYGIDSVLSAIEKVRNSKYLQGNSKSGWTITFDWFVLPNNFPKVLEGNYDDKENNSDSKYGKWGDL